MNDRVNFLTFKTYTLRDLNLHVSNTYFCNPVLGNLKLIKIHLSLYSKEADIFNINTVKSCGERQPQNPKF
jgi:hypothetical protein